MADNVKKYKHINGARSIESMQHAIPCLFMRGGTSRGPFFNAADLPTDVLRRDRVLLNVMRSPDRRRIDGPGGAHPLTCKLEMASRSSRPGIDLEFLSAQRQPDADTVDTTPDCGNLLAAVVPFALETRLATRSFIPHMCHEATGVLAAVTVATACVSEDSAAQGLASVPLGVIKQMSVKHPSGEFSVELETDPVNPQTVKRAALLRTAHLIVRGEVRVSESAFMEGDAA
jgi:2-methylaconitate cis-trans-isomerase PrpF